jgi:hypothetical protein
MDKYDSDIFCKYNSGMCVGERFPERLVYADLVHERRAVAYHEAGHAVLDYALGFDIERLSVGTTTYTDCSRVFYGASQTKKLSFARIRCRVNAGRFHPDLLSFGIAIVAGPAAERKYRVRHKLPQTCFGAAMDEKKICYVTNQLAKNERSGWAFRRLVWRRAQLALEHPMVWSAVSALADHLWWNWRDDEDVGEHKYICPGARARSIIRGEGVRLWMDLPRTMAELVDLAAAEAA